MTDGGDQMRDALRGVTQELGKAAEQAQRTLRQAARDLGDLVGEGRRPPAPGASPIELIRQLGHLRDEGLITPEEFERKKADLLSRV